MNNVILLGIFFAIIMPCMMVMGAWAYRIFALKEQLKETEDRVHARMDRIEARMGTVEQRIHETHQTLQQHINDIGRYMARTEVMLEKLGEKKP